MDNADPAPAAYESGAGASREGGGWPGGTGDGRGVTSPLDLLGELTREEMDAAVTASRELG